MEIDGNPRHTDVFEEYLQKNSRVCSDCFSLRKCVYELRDDWGNVAMHAVEGKNTERAKVESPTAWACKRCGTVDEWNNKAWRNGRDEPVDYGGLMRLVENISETLDEFDIKHERRLMKRIAQEMKGNPKMSGKDDEILRHAVNEGVSKDMSACPECGKLFVKERRLKVHAQVEHDRSLPGTDTDYGSRWGKVRQKVLERDDHECRICGDDKSDIGRSPDVHHIKPLREFDNIAKANELDNLVTLCRRHHMMVEYSDLAAPKPE